MVEKQNRAHNIGTYTLDLPHDHFLDVYQKLYPRYDYILGEIAKIVFEHFPLEDGAIDIGANIGDSAALLRKYHKIPILCIEGVPYFLEFLKRNCANIGEQITIEAAFVGTGEEKIPDSFQPLSGTYSLTSSQTETTTPTLTLSTILERRKEFSRAKLIKIDTDGFDFKIIKSSLNELAKMKPILFFEYDIFFSKEGSAEALETMNLLQDIGYQHFIVYDNFGNFMLSLEGVKKFSDLNTCLLSNKTHHRALYYFDICAFPNTDKGYQIFKEVMDVESRGHV